MIIRMWKGTTTLENAAAYETLLREVVFPRIAAKNVTGYQGIQLLKSIKETKVDFITLMGFAHFQAVKDFAGDNYEKSYVIDEAKKLLHAYDATADHYELQVNDLSFQV